MALVNLFKNQLSDEFESFSIKGGLKLSDLSSVLKLNEVEIYNQKTQETYFKSEVLEDCTVIVNDQEQPLNYVIQDDDVISIYPRQFGGGEEKPGNKNVVAGVATTVGTWAVVGLVTLVGGPVAGVAAAITLGVVGTATGGSMIATGVQENKEYAEQKAAEENKAKSYESGENSQSLLALRGGKNQSIIGQRFPYIFGQHLVSPRVIGSPYTEISSKDNIGDIVVQRQLMVVGCSPLKITDIKFEENIVAYNRSTNINGNNLTRRNVFHGKLKGVNDSNDGGDIVKKWKNNNIEIEILQDFESNSDKDIYGTIYPQAVIQKDVDANIMHIYDKNLENQAQITYKNSEFVGGFRTNTVRFSHSCPQKIEVEVDFKNGLYATDTYSDDSVSEPRYYKIPCRLAVQWRYVRKSGQVSSNADDPGNDWKSFTRVTDTAHASFGTYTAAMASEDISANKGLSDGTSTTYNTKWIGANCFTLGQYDSTSYKKGTVNINQRRYVFSYNFTNEEALKLCAEDSEYLDTVEVRVVRLTPMYLDETDTQTSDQTFSNRCYQDLCSWTVMRTYCFDKDQFLENTNQPLSSIPLRPLSKVDMRKFCVIAIKAEPDKAGTISNAFDKVNVIATALSPKLDAKTNQWLPELKSENRYYYQEKDDNGKVTSFDITEEEYNNRLVSGLNAFKARNGNNFVSTIKSEIFTSANKFSNHDFVNYELKQSVEDKYISRNPASAFLLSLVGGHLGVDAKDYSMVNIGSLNRFYKFCEDVVDGQPDPKSSDGLKHLKYQCNGVIGSEKKLGTLLSEILITGRAVATYDDEGKLKVFIDEPRKYPEMVLSQQNCLSGSNSKSFDQLPSGYEISFVDEADNYDNNTIFAMDDGEDYKNPRRELMAYSLNYITNRDQLWSLGRYFLGTKKLQKETYTRVVGKIGRLLHFGSFILLRDETLSVGTDKGGRIVEMIEDDNLVYGFIIDEVYKYTGELDENGRCKKGFVLVQPQEFGASKVVTLRMCTPSGVQASNGELLVPVIGETNVVILEEPILKDTEGGFVEGQWVKVCPQIDNLVEFGEVGNITKPVIVTSVKPSDKNTFTITACEYNEKVYKYGKELPSTQSFKPIHDTALDSFQISEYLTRAETQSLIATNFSRFVERRPESKDPDTPIINSVTLVKEGIEYFVSIADSPVNAVQSFEWEVDKGDGLGYQPFFIAKKKEEKQSLAGVYEEAEYFANWKFRVRLLNVYGKYSDFSSERLIDTSYYGTWKLTQPLILPQTQDRTAMLRLSLKPRSDLKEVYGNIRYKIVIQRLGNEDIKDTEDYVAPDVDWYQPATDTYWMDNEENYRQGDPVGNFSQWLECASFYSQTLPLLGQTNERMVATAYNYKVVAYNEAGYSVESDAVSVTALPTNITDLVHSNENYKDLYVQRLSAISANVGLISQGGFGSFKTAENYWALSDLYPEETGLDEVVKKGAFRVGGKEQYIEVKPTTKNGQEDFAVSVKAGNLNFESDKTDIDGRVYAYDRNDPTKRFRTALSDTGIEFQEATSYDDSGVGDAYKVNGFVKQTQSGSLFMTNSDPSNESLPLERVKIPSSVNVYHFDEDLKNQQGEEHEGVTFDGNLHVAETPLSSTAFNGTMSINNDGKYSTMFYTNSNLVVTDIGLIYRDGTVGKNLNNRLSDLGITTGNVFKYK